MASGRLTISAITLSTTTGFYTGLQEEFLFICQHPPLLSLQA